MPYRLGEDLRLQFGVFGGAFLAQRSIAKGGRHVLMPTGTRLDSGGRLGDQAPGFQFDEDRGEFGLRIGAPGVCGLEKTYLVSGTGENDCPGHSHAAGPDDGDGFTFYHWNSSLAMVVNFGTV